MTQKPNLIGVAGRIGSGKDTVGSIIQFLTAGDASLNCIKRIRGGLDIQGYHNSNFTIKKFAGKLKEVASLLTGIPADQFEDQKFKDSYMSSSWSYSKQITEFDGDEGEDAYAFLPMTYRLFLQKLGTEAVRNGLHPNTWVNALFADYFKTCSQTKTIKCRELNGGTFCYNGQEENQCKHFPNWIITDLRFPNEFEAIKSRGGVCIRVHRLKDVKHWEDEHGMKFGSFTKEEPTHTSETALDNHKMDYVLNNSGSIEDLVEEIKKMLVHFKLLD